MMISVFSVGSFLIMPGAGSHINLASDYGFYTLFKAFLIEINDTIHNPVIGNGSRVHPKLFHAGYVFLYFVRAIQKAILCMGMKMYK